MNSMQSSALLSIPVLHPRTQSVKDISPKSKTACRNLGGGTVFCNPPYGRQMPLWIEKAYRECENGTTVVLLIPARTDTKYFHDYIYGKHEIRFIRGRLHFNESKQSAPFPSMVVIMRPRGGEMVKQSKYVTQFVDKMPETLEDGVLYIAPHFECAVHKCMCGCGEKVCTPLNEGMWKWSYDGTNVSLNPSVGNFQQPCKSHYFLKNGVVQWC